MIKSYCLFDPLLKSGLPDLHVNELIP
jgi:hypothetical protein